MSSDPFVRACGVACFVAAAVLLVVLVLLACCGG